MIIKAVVITGDRHQFCVFIESFSLLRIEERNRFILIAMYDEDRSFVPCDLILNMYSLGYTDIVSG